MWNTYLDSLPPQTRPRVEQRGYRAWHFCENKRSANELGNLVVRGEKRATTSSLRAYEIEGELLPACGDLSVITDWEGTALCIIQTTELEIKSFNNVSSEFAWKEGEGDKSLSYWQKAHHQSFSVEHALLGLPFDEHIPVLCEEFRVIWPPEIASKVY